MNNINFIINTYLLQREALRAKEVVWEIRFYRVHWFMRKAIWSSVAHIKSNAAIFKKFYKFMHEKGEIDNEALEKVNWMVKEEMAEWIEEMEKFENLAYSDDLFGLQSMFCQVDLKHNKNIVVLNGVVKWKKAYWLLLQIIRSIVLRLNNY